MTYLTPGEWLRFLRMERGLSQRQLADLVGVSQGRYSHWENELRCIPPRYRAPVAAALGVEEASLAPDSHARPPGRPSLLECINHGPRRMPVLPEYKVQGRIEQMLQLGGLAEDLLHAAQRRLSPAQVARLDSRFPRDTVHELMCVFHALAEGGHLGRETLLRLRCPVLTVETWGSSRCAVYHERDVVHVQKGDVGIVMVPQVWVPAIVQAEWYRLDFLTLVRRQDGTERWADVEIDGFHPHGLTPENDQRRARGIGGATRVGFWNREVTRPDFGERLISRLIALLHQPDAPFTTRPRSATER